MTSAFKRLMLSSIAMIILMFVAYEAWNSGISWLKPIGGIGMLVVLVGYIAVLFFPLIRNISPIKGSNDEEGREAELKEEPPDDNQPIEV